MILDLRENAPSIGGKYVHTWKNMLGIFYMVASTGDVIYIGADLPNEYSGSNIHIVLREQMPRRKQMQHREFLKW